MSDVARIQAILAPLFPGLMGIELREATPDRVVAAMRVRPDLCTTGASLHGGAFMAFADTLGAVGTFLNLPDRRTHHDHGLVDQVHPRRAGRVHRDRHRNGVPQGPDHAGVADAGDHRGRQAVRGGDADAAGDPQALKPRCLL